MKALDITKHKTNLTNILIDIYKNSSLGPSLGFKGGTAAMLFYGLPRFSIDLDFDLKAPISEEFKNKITKLLASKYKIKDQSHKHNTLFWLLSYGENLSNIKVEISTREVPYNHYHLESFYGVNISVLNISDMIAHKMVAATERSEVANRDLFDIHFFLSRPEAGEINYDIIKHRTGKNPIDFYSFLYDFISKIDSKSVLNGLGEVLTDSQKDWAKVKLIEELKTLILRQKDLVDK